ncbi:hypothetical protein HY524_00440 [Candidatus Berkelbacteria bacterium]|nr:hypothetical protein [Candidatus Berkelbacteria bacterium]
MSMHPYLLLFVGGTLLTFGDLVAKEWVQADRPALFVATLGFYLIGLVFLIVSFRTKNIAVASALFVTANIVTLALVSWLWFHEPLSRRQLTGLVVTLIGILIMESARASELI